MLLPLAPDNSTPAAAAVVTHLQDLFLHRCLIVTLLAARQCRQKLHGLLGGLSLTSTTLTIDHQGLAGVLAHHVAEGCASDEVHMGGKLIHCLKGANCRTAAAAAENTGSPHTQMAFSAQVCLFGRQLKPLQRPMPAWELSSRAVSSCCATACFHVGELQAAAPAGPRLNYSLRIAAHPLSG
jgi:hypothetical protein